ncbi:MAG TPA: hypothetical protein VK636_06165 [Gemmatimonadaceae bacterium]|nr:hypothetical protein [Gemmatimonadaceae bacterium]
MSAVFVRRARIVWRASVDVGEGESLSEAVNRLLATAPTWVFAPRVRVVVGEGYGQVKQLHGLPPMKHPRLASQVVRENASSFFALTGHRIVVSDVDQRSDGSTWGAAFTGDILEQMVLVLSQRGLTRPTFLPAPVAIARLATDGPHRIVDDSVATTFTVNDGAVVALARVPVTDESEDITLVPAISASIGPEGMEYVRAYAGAVARRAAGPSWRSSPPVRRTRLLRRAGLTLAGALLIATLVAALFAPGARAHRAIAVLTREVAFTRASELEASRTEAMLRRVTGDLDRIERVRARRGRTTLLLAGLSQALPESTALISLRLDSLEGSFVAVTPHAVDILPQLSAVDLIGGARIVGSVTREPLGSIQVERATVRFRTGESRVPSVRPSTAASAAERRK